MLNLGFTIVYLTLISMKTVIKQKVSYNKIEVCRFIIAIDKFN